MTRVGRRLVVAGSVAVVAAIASGWAILGSASTSQALPSSSPVAVVTPSPTPTETPTASPTPSPNPTPSPTASSLPPAGSYPIVNSCDPASVPGSIQVPGSGAMANSSFTLHVPILEYHRVIPKSEAGNSQPGLVVAPSAFSDSLDAFKKAGWRTITMASLASDLAAHVKPPAKTFVITFDDGWDDGYTYAFPALQKHGYVATFFVIAGRIDHPGDLTSAHLRELIDAGDEIGDHTMDHVELTSIAPAKVPYQVDAAAARIAQVTGRWPASLAYPYGGVNNRVATLVASCQEMRIAALDGPLKMTYPAAKPAPGATRAPARVQYLQAYETASNRFAVPRIKISPGMTPTGILAKMGAG